MSEFPNLPTVSPELRNNLTNNYAPVTQLPANLNSLIPLLTAQIMNALFPQIQQLLQQILPTIINHGP